MAQRGIPGIRRAPARIGLAADVGVLVLVTNVEPQVVYDISGVLNHVGALAEVTDSSLAAQVLELDDVVRVGCRRETGEDALVGEHEGAGADGQQGALARGVSLLELGKGVDELEGLGLLLDDGLDIAAEDDENVEIGQALVGLLPGHLRADENALVREDFGLAGGNGALKGTRRCECIRVSAWTDGFPKGRPVCAIASSLTRVIGIMERRGEHLEGAGEVKEVELGVQRKQHIDGLVGDRGILVVCHRDDWWCCCVVGGG